MDVSNSTDQNTGYRIVGAGGNRLEYESLATQAYLEPGQTEECRFLVPSGPFRVQFFIDGQEVACATFRKGPEVVSLYEDEWGLRVQSEPGPRTGLTPH